MDDSSNHRQPIKKLIGLFLLFIVIGVAGLAWAGAQIEARIWALDSADGAIRWSVALRTGEQAYAAMPPVTNAALLIGWVARAENAKDTITLVAWDRMTGVERWRWTLPAEQHLDYEDPLLATTNRIYFSMIDGDDQQTLVALDATTGREQWQLPSIVAFATLPPPAASAALENADDILILSGKQGSFVLARHAAMEGSVRWRVTQTLDEQHLWLRPSIVATTQATYLFQQAGSVTAQGNWEANGTYDAQGYALADGAETIHYQYEGQDPVFYLGPTAVHASGYTLLGINEPTGTLEWRYAVNDPNTPDKMRYLQAITAITDMLYLVIGPNNFDELGWLVAINPTDGREWWRAQVINEGFSLLNPPIATATAIGVQGDGGFVAVDRQSGAIRWTFAADALVLSAGADENTFYFAERSPRWRTWLTLLAPNWRARAYSIAQLAAA